ncbi:PREDICTED: uncharacterized protein LOC104609641 isoform X2 [Nelumbo nucifera]|uniref:Uncharacterized protein LOC104609641 isoform X2 n=1 Tax=Nelumbo nucifera TaxID=4432 RepID=A0A1U8B0R8_NELNU|nr:PREDICTED: uncharacterized protein LOC104609641 isoform X2 [Nelumbo nucifera]
MEKPVEEVAVVDADGEGANLQHSEKRPVRHRLIQSTLFGHRPQPNKVEEEEIQAVEVEDDEEGDEGEEYCGRSRKGKSKRKRNATGQQRAANKAPVTGKESLSQRTGNRQSLHTSGSDFFLKASERRLKQRQQKEQDENDFLEGGNLSKRSPRQLKKQQQQRNSIPCEGLSPGHSRGQLPINHKSDGAEDRDIQSPHTPQPVIDLRLEAKITAEENARLFSGKQIHPFFSSWKAGKKFQENVDTSVVESKGCCILQNDESITCGPIHVFDMLQDDQVLLDWKNWTFCEPCSSCSPEHECSSVFEGSIKPLKFDNFLPISDYGGTSFLQNELQLDKSINQEKNMPAMSVTISISVNGKVAHYELSKYLEVAYGKDDIGFSTANNGCLSNSDMELQNKSLQGRMASYYLDCGKLPDGNLWTTKYQPRKAAEVCGNSESVKFLSEWLHLWHERDLQTNKTSTSQDECSSKDSDHGWFEDDSDTESMEEGDALKNVLLVLGPVGCGKSAAIYACAEEQGFQVIEVSASDWRNGALMKEKFKEAVESHRFKWSTKNSMGSLKNPILGLSSAPLHSRASQELDSEVIELNSTDEEEAENTMIESANNANGYKENGTASTHGGRKTLVLFEDVDIVFDEDRGFVSAIQQFAEKARRPIILTSNCEDPLLPDHLDRLEVSFTIPSPKELFSHIYMVCTAEKADVQPQLIERFIECCQGDIRKTMLLLQFWCQGKRHQQGNKVHCAYGELPFDLEAGHWILPKIIPWQFSSQLSKLVENEITKSLSMMKENEGLMDVEEEALKEVEDAFGVGNNEIDSIKAKKEVMLRNCSIHDENIFTTQFNGICDSDSSGSPVTFTRRIVRQGHNAIMSSPSGDECLDGELPEVSEDPRVEVLPGSFARSPSHVAATHNYLDPSATCQLHHSEGEISEQNLHKCLEISDQQDTCKSIDVSCVPESSFVPETEISGGGLLCGTVSCGNVTVMAEADSTSNARSIQSMSLMGVENIEDTTAKLDKNVETLLRNISDVDAVSVQGDEEIGDSQNEDVATVSRGYQVMDECSRMDFYKGTTFIKSFRFASDPVKEAWKKLRSCREELKPYVTSEHNHVYQIVKLASGLTNLFSEADILLRHCQLLISDSLAPPMVPCVEPDAFCWCHDQLDMTSTIAEHGLCFFEKENAAVESNLGSEHRLDLSWEMLTCATNTMALGKLVRQDISTNQTSCSRRLWEIGRPSKVSATSKIMLHLHNTIQSMIPPRSYSVLKSDALHEYMSSLGQISRLGASRSSQNNRTKSRRARAARHYLSTCDFTLSPEDLSLLAQYGHYGKATLDMEVS